MPIKIRRAAVKIMFENSDLIYSYTTKQAVEDGCLVKVPAGMPQRCGIKFPVYFTRAAFDKYVEVPAGFEGQQDLEGRLIDILVMFSYAAKKTDGDAMIFKFVCLIPEDTDREANERKCGMGPDYRLVKLKSVISAQDIDDPSPAIFIMKPDED